VRVEDSIEVLNVYINSLGSLCGQKQSLCWESLGKESNNSKL